MTEPDGSSEAPALGGHHGWRLLHVGAHAELWAAVQDDFGRPVAVKVFHGDETSAALARRRAAAMGRSSGFAGSVPLLSVATLPDGRTAMVMPLLEGSLADRSPSLDAEPWQRWFIQSSEALGELHSNGLTHSNLRAGNILISADGSAVLSDPDGDGPGQTGDDPAAVVDDLRSLVASFAGVAPASDAIGTLISVVGSRGEHLEALGIDTAARLTQFIPRELRRPAVVAGSGARGSRRGVRWALLAAALVLAGLVTASALTLGSDDDDERRASATDDTAAEADRSSTTTSEPERPLIEGTAVDVSVSGGQACSLLEGGDGVCWGSNVLLEGTDVTGAAEDAFAFDTRPFPLEGGPFDAVDMGSDGSGNQVVCAVAGGAVSCRGWELVAIPDGITEEDLNRSDLLQPVAGVESAVDVTVGTRHACALLADTTVRCWGSDAVGQLGDGIWDEYGNGPVPGLTGVAEVVAGWEATCALKLDGSVWCWGLAEPPIGTLSTPTQVTGIPPMVELAVGRSLLCGVEANGQLWCWGDFERAFGVRTADIFTPPTVIEVGEPVSSASTDEGQLCVVAEGGSVRCNTEGSEALTEVVGVDDVDQVDTHTTLTCARRRDGSVWCWGPVTEDLEDPPAAPEPVSIDGLG